MDLEKLIENAEQGHDIEIHTPNKIIISLDALNNHIHGDLIGVETGKYLVIKLPKIDRIARENLKVGAPLIIRYLHKGSVFAFQTNIIGSISIPVELVFLTFPLIVSRHELRRNPRVDCHLLSELNWEKEKLPGMVVDLSVDGCRFISNELNGNYSSHSQSKDVVLNLNQSHDYGLNEFYGVVRQLKVKHTACQMGIEFKKVKEEQRIFLTEFLHFLEQAAKLRA